MRTFSYFYATRNRVMVADQHGHQMVVAEMPLDEHAQTLAKLLTSNLSVMESGFYPLNAHHAVTTDPADPGTTEEH
jgi:hypothetical protein